MNPDLQLFLQAWTGGADVSDSDREHLLQLFENDATFREECVEEIQLLGMIKAVQASGPRWLEIYDALGLSTTARDDLAADDLASRVLHRVQVEPRNRVNDRWFSWRPLTAGAAGILFGLFSASFVLGFGFAGRSLEKVVSLLQESFESGPAPLVTGIPQELNLWSGDYSEIVEKHEGVKPKDGTKMVRVLRSDYDGKTSSKPSKQGDLMRVVDVRPFLREVNGGEVVITLSALFNAAPFPEADRYDGAVYLYALGQIDSTEESLLEDALAHSHGGCRSLDRDPATWQSASTRLLLPTGTKFVMLKVSFRRWPKGSEDQPSLPDLMTFAGHFVDDVRASIRIRNAVTDHSTLALP
jgi:hypothetical protein